MVLKGIAGTTRSDADETFRSYRARPEVRRSRTSPGCGRDAQKPHVLAKRGYVKCVTLGRAKFKFDSPLRNVVSAARVLCPAAK